MFPMQRIQVRQVHSQKVESYVSKYKAQASFPKNTKINTIRKQKKRAKPIKIPAEQGRNLFPQKI